MDHTIWRLVLTLFLLVPALSYGSKSADELAEMCTSDSETAKSRCIGYIHGYLDAINTAEPANDSNWRQRAIETRIGTKLRVRYDDSGTPVCFSDSDAALSLKVRILTEAQQGSGTAAEWVEALARSEFPCK